MPDTALETPASKVVCKSKDCGKEYASKGGMMDHYKKMHVLTLLQRIMAKCQMSCGDVEMAKQRIGQARNIF